MTDFDEQWKNVMDEEHFNEMKGKFDFYAKTSRGISEIN